MKINQDILSIPPFISTSWKNISALHLEGNHLIITLLNGAMIRIPNQNLETLEKIFAAHAAYMEDKEGKEPRQKPKRKGPDLNLEVTMPAGINGLDTFNALIQHNPEQSNAPDLPPKILSQIALMTEMMGLKNLGKEALPKAEPHCNCFHCQIARAVDAPVNQNEEPQEEFVTDEDLHFRDWEITQKDNLYIVSSPLDPDESYKVSLSPIGCTCGQPGCEHIKAVLKT